MKLFSKSTVRSRSGVAACKYVYHKFKNKNFRNHSTESYLNILILTFITCRSERFVFMFPVPTPEDLRSDWTMTVNGLSALRALGRFHCGLHEFSVFVLIFFFTQRFGCRRLI
ncbi:Hypothetical predicted protein [Xyrichtys novacula]|uniref:Uncharacterized protein n=1 Tax=Xyrichtys novacula TaxID=13765 RepID=A0AAV1H995_XYRNO|nr:Hypothetical predicted protein [Xyrichtys novacula]